MASEASVAVSDIWLISTEAVYRHSINLKKELQIILTDLGFILVDER